MWTNLPVMFCRRWISSRCSDTSPTWDSPATQPSRHYYSTIEIKIKRWKRWWPLREPDPWRHQWHHHFALVSIDCDVISLFSTFASKVTVTSYNMTSYIVLLRHTALQYIILVPYLSLVNVFRPSHLLQLGNGNAHRHPQLLQHFETL